MDLPEFFEWREVLGLNVLRELLLEELLREPDEAFLELLPELIEDLNCDLKEDLLDVDRALLKDPSL